MATVNLRSVGRMRNDRPRLLCASRHSACSPVSAVTGRGLAVGLGLACQTEEAAMLTMLKTLLAAVAIVGLMEAALTSSRLAKDSGCTNCAVSAPFTLQPTTIVVACITSGC
jgi:hypothetical protein